MAIRLRGKGWGFLKKKTHHGNKPTFYNGRTYQSKFEASYARDLDYQKKAGMIQEWEPQIKFRLVVNDHLICHHYVDFRIVYSDGRVELHETKGHETDVYKLKRKLLDALYLSEHPEIQYRVVKSK